MGKRGSVGDARRARRPERSGLVLVAGMLAVHAMDGCGGEVADEVIEFSVGGTPVASPVGGRMTAGAAGAVVSNVGGANAGRGGVAGWMVVTGGWVSAGRASAGRAGALPMTGGQASAGRGGAGGPVAAGVPTPNGVYTYGSYTGRIWGVSDTGGSTITLTANNLCASGTAVQVPSGDGGLDYGAWGASLSWNLNEPLLLDGGVPSPANLAGMTAITVSLAGSIGLNLRLLLEVRDSDSGGPVNYCAPLPWTGASLALSSLTQDCWTGTGTAFDPTTMYPVSLSVQVVSDPGQAYPFNFCVTALGIW